MSKQSKDQKQEKINKPEICIKICQKLPPNLTSQYLSKISPTFINNESKRDISKYLLTPLVINESDSLGYFLNSDFNKDGDSFRSPWSNEYFPNNEGHRILSNELRELEKHLNKLFKIYTTLYYNDNTISSVYIWEQGDSINSGFNCSVLIKNLINDNKFIYNSFLDCINVINVKFNNEIDQKKNEKLKATYKITCTMLYEINIKGFENCGFIGNIYKVMEEFYYIKDYLDYQSHINSIGKLVEFIEGQLREQLNEIIFNKCYDIITKMRRTFIIGKQNYQQANNLKELYIEFIKKKNDEKK